MLNMEKQFFRNNNTNKLLIENVNSFTSYKELLEEYQERNYIPLKFSNNQLVSLAYELLNNTAEKFIISSIEIQLLPNINDKIFSRFVGTINKNINKNILFLNLISPMNIIKNITFMDNNKRQDNKHISFSIDNNGKMTLINEQQETVAKKFIYKTFSIK